MSAPANTPRLLTTGGRSFLSRAVRLASPEGYHLLLALFLLLEVDARLRCSGYTGLQRALQRPTRTPKGMIGSEELQQEARRMAQVIRVAARAVPRARCLHRALALLLWLHRRGLTADLRMGVRSAGQAIEGHAWVESNGIALDEDPSICDRFHLLEPPRYS
jgi:hypothetical protein